MPLLINLKGYSIHVDGDDCKWRKPHESNILSPQLAHSHWLLFLWLQVSWLNICLAGGFHLCESIVDWIMAMVLKANWLRSETQHTGVNRALSRHARHDSFWQAWRMT
jgi:hypothetical protein